MSFSITKLAKKAQGLEKRVERDKKQTAELMNDLMDGGSVVAGMFLGGTIDASMENPAIGSVDKSAIAGGVTAIVSPFLLGKKYGKKGILFGLGMASGEIRQAGAGVGAAIREKMAAK